MLKRETAEAVNEPYPISVSHENAPGDWQIPRFRGFANPTRAICDLLNLA
jgi:hypothetical protein